MSGIPGPATVARDALSNVRIFLQEKEDPMTMENLDYGNPASRVVVFAYHLGLSILEHSKGRDALVETGLKVWGAWSYRDRKQIALDPRPKTDSARMGGFVDYFLSRCRTNPPNFVISDRVEGEAEVQRLKWFDPTTNREYKRDGDPPYDNKGNTPYDAKRAGYMFVSKIIVDDTIHQASEVQYTADFHKNLFILGVSIAHELVHLFIGYIAGDERDTPPRVHDRVPPSSYGKGESGRAWEKELLGGICQTHFNSRNGLGDRQAGMIYHLPNQMSGMAREIDPQWMRRILEHRFDFPARTTGPEIKAKNLPQAMEDRRHPSTAALLMAMAQKKDLDEIEMMDVFSVNPLDLRKLMRVVNEPSQISA